jgi:hypothetical protein
MLTNPLLQELDLRERREALQRAMAAQRWASSGAAGRRPGRSLPAASLGFVRAFMGAGLRLRPVPKTGPASRE